MSSTEGAPEGALTEGREEGLHSEKDVVCVSDQREVSNQEGQEEELEY